VGEGDRQLIQAHPFSLLLRLAVEVDQRLAAGAGQYLNLFKADILARFAQGFDYRFLGGEADR